MIISHKHKFIFIKSEKTAGTSVELFLAKFCGQSDIITPIEPQVAGHKPSNHKGIFNPIPEILEAAKNRKWRMVRRTVTNFVKRNKYYNHIPALAVKYRLGHEQWNSYYKFTIERNPYEKLPSHYFMRLQRGKVSSLEDYFRKGNYPVNYDKYMSYGAKALLVDRVIQFANLYEELKNVLTHLGIKIDRVELPKEKSDAKPKNIDYRSFVRQEGLEVRIKEIFNIEIELFDFKLNDD